MAIAFVQKVVATGVNATSITTPAFASNTTVGNVLIGTGGFADVTAGHTVTFSDSKTNTWVTNKQTNNTAANGGYAGIGSTTITTGGASHTVSMTDTGGVASACQLTASEWSGLTTTVDQSAANTAGANTTSLTATTAATTNANDLVIGCWIGDGNNASSGVGSPAQLNGTSTGVTSLNVVASQSILATECSYSIISSTGTQAMKWTYTTDTGGAYEAVIVAFKGPASVPSQPVEDDFGFFPDVLGGADQAFGEDDQAVIMMTADSASVGPNQPDMPVQDDAQLIEWWQDYEDPTVDDAQWSGPVQPQAPPSLAFEDTWLEEDPADEPIGEDSIPVGANQPSLPVEDAWDWGPEDHADDLPDDDGWIPQNSSAQTPPQCPDDAWDWSEPEDLTDDQWEDDGFNVQNTNVIIAPPNPVEDGWDWSEPQDLWDESPDEDGSNVQNANQVVLSGNGPEDPWNWEEESTEDNWWEDCLDDGYNSQNSDVIPPPTPLVNPETIGTVPGILGKKRKRKAEGPVMREDQVFGEEYPVSPFISSTARTPTRGVSDEPKAETQRSGRMYASVIKAMLEELL